jgi:hypothetical protein
MKLRLVFVGALLCLLAGCVTNAALRDSGEKLDRRNSEITEAIAAVDNELVSLRATTQPTATPEAIAAEADAEKQLMAARSEAVAAQARAAAAKVGLVVAATPTVNPGTVIKDAIPQQGFNWKDPAAYTSIAVAVVWALVENRKRKGAQAEAEAADSAGKAAVDAIQTLINKGKVVVTDSAEARGVVNADMSWDENPITDELLRVIENAPKK